MPLEEKPSAVASARPPGRASMAPAHSLNSQDRLADQLRATSNDAAAKLTRPVIIVVESVGRGKFRAWINGGPELAPASATPFLTSCRKLLDLGCDPHQRAVMRH